MSDPADSEQPPQRDRWRTPAERRAAWGDDPEEVQASEVVQEFEADEAVQRHWHQHPAVAPFKVVARFIQRSGKRIGVTIAGFLLLIVAVIIIPIPGPWSILLTIVALSILATEYIWAQKMLRYAKEKADQAKSMVFKKKGDETPPA
jgi:uncharacterized protein (TIGR02611 family)